MVAINQNLAFDPEALAKVCHEYGVKKLAVFGSVARGEAESDSDIDLLYELLPGRTMSYITLEDLAEQLRPIFGGRYVDLGKVTQLHWYIRDQIAAESKVIYGG